MLGREKGTRKHPVKSTSLNWRNKIIQFTCLAENASKQSEISGGEMRNSQFYGFIFLKLEFILFLKT